MRIFLGYAPGVGKTFALLSAAQRRYRDGQDVVIAQVDTHGDPTLEGLLATMGEAAAAVDVEQLLARRPQIVVIDNLVAHNAPSARHPQRYQDIEELLDAGINVYTTLNVQHIESLKDVVTQITELPVTETVPDRLLDLADPIELVDIPAEDLLERWENGRIHSDMSDADSARFFRLGNLTALRELALRQLSRRVNDKMRAYMKDRAIRGPWATSERLLVCISPSPMSASLVRAGCRLAQQMGVAWHAVYVDAPTLRPLREADQTRLNDTVHMAQSLGASVETITGGSIAHTLIEYARQHNITQIIIGQPLRPRWQEALRGSVVNQLIRLSGPINVHVFSGEPEQPARQERPSTPLAAQIAGYVQALLVLAVATLAATMVNTNLSLNPENLVMFYLLAVMVVALRSGYGPAVLTAVGSVFVFNFFFVPPQFTLRVAEAEYLITFLGLLVTGVVIANLTARAQQQTAAAQRRERDTAQLYALSRKLSATIDPQIIVRSIVEHSRQTFRCETGLFLPQNDQVQAHFVTTGYYLDETEQEAAAWAFTHARPAGRGTATLPMAAARYEPLKTAQRTVGVLGLRLTSPTSLEDEQLIDAFATQAAQALEATQLGEEARQAQILREKEKLQTAVLNSISHDLRTPLVAITGALSSLRESDSFFDAAARRELLDGAYQEAERLNQLVGNLLDMSRLEAHTLKLKRELYDLQEIIGVARAHLRSRLADRQILIDMAPDLPMVSVDLVLFAQALANLLDNAVKYSKPQTPIEIRAGQEADHVFIEVADRGIGIPEAELPHIFDKFYRANGGNGRGGSGLGLSICQGIVEFHNGRLYAQNRPGGGSRFTIELPLPAAESNDNQRGL